MTIMYTRYSLFTLFFLLPTLISAHLVEVPAGKKDCYFEDLHTQDKVFLFPPLTCDAPHGIHR